MARGAGPLMTKGWLEQIALEQVRQQFPDLRRHGFAAAIRALHPDLKGYRYRFLPDGWTVERVGDGFEKDRPAMRFTCIEVEDSSLLTPAKLQSYARLWFNLDFFWHELRLLVFDRYGLNQRELSLPDIWSAGFHPIREGALKERRGCLDWPPPRVKKKCRKPNEAAA
jgi:hypothetical protein